ncbi:BMP family ABC transporter substrate-binding protein, partial [Kibdelosporangium lantanae]
MSKRLPLVALLLGLLAACTKAVAGQPVAVPNPTKPKPPLLLVTVLPTGDDPQFTQIKKAVEDYAAAHHGTAKTIVTSASPDNSAQLAISAIRQHPTVLVMATPNTQKLATLVTTYSTQQFLIVNTCTGKTPPKNVTCTDTRDHEGVYLMGVEAGLLTSTGKVGAVVSSNTIPQLKRYSVPFGRGA